MLEEIYRQIWLLSANMLETVGYRQLSDLTQELIKINDDKDLLSVNPFQTAWERTLSLPFAALNNLLKNSVCLVTGGVGCVGNTLIINLLKFNIARLIVLDKAAAPLPHNDKRVEYIVCDVSDKEAVIYNFRNIKPAFVFHTAAERKPGYAEMHVEEAVCSNIQGTLNIVTACELTGVKQCVFSSTGKASRYYTEEVYAQTKKFCEYILDVKARKATTLFSMARFTHIIDNSLMNLELQEAAFKKDYVAVHSPGKYVTAQNAQEAACLLLNALLYAEPFKCNFLIVKNLEWPVESLSVALYYIKQSGRKIPVIFKGNPAGYREKFFRGQLNWLKPDNLNLLINVYEYRYYKANKEDDIIISNICPVNEQLLAAALNDLTDNESKQPVTQKLSSWLSKLVADSLYKTEKTDTVNILNWGLKKQLLQTENASLKDYMYTVPLLADSLRGTEYYKQVELLLDDE